MRRLVGALLLLLLMPAFLCAQAVIGSLLYADPVGGGIQLTVVDAGPGRMTLRTESGREDQLRKLVLAMAGPESLIAPGAVHRVEGVPPSWRVGGFSGGAVLRREDVTYWRFHPGQVLPIRFLFEGRMWTLQSADLPARSFVR